MRNLFKDTHRQLMIYLVVGAIGTAGHYAVLISLVEGLSTNPVYATTAGFIVGAFINYILNYVFTFKSDKSHATAFTQYFIVATLGAIINSALMYLGTSVSLHYMIAQVIATLFVVTITFQINRHWTFARRTR